ncbi:MAG: hypothetical protein PHP98_07400 [Kiritimatiellae bacterium]|nr:hypothetical protein [Kiritimatiellia bacterium]
MRKITAIALLTIRAALRSRSFAAAAFFLIIIIAGLPFVIKGDGTPESRADIFINYSFGLLMFVLSLIAAWSGAGAISLEISGRQMQNVAVKPLNAFQVWAGKLTGLMAINLFLLAAGGTLIAAMLNGITRPMEAGDGRRRGLRREIMSVYRTVLPIKASSSAGKTAAIGPGENHIWHFNSGMQNGRTPFALIKFRFIPSPFSYQTPVSGHWRLSDGKGPDFINQTTTSSPNMTACLNASALNISGALELEYTNLQTNPPVTVFFLSEEDLCLLLPESTFESNLLRGLIMGFARLVFFTSLGMIAGALFTFPVAVFTSMGLLITALAGGLARQIAEKGLWLNASHEQLSPAAAMLNEAARGLFRLLSAVFPPLDRFNPLAFLADSLFIPWSLAGEAFAVIGILYPLVLMLIGAACLRRREIGIASP